MAWLYHVNHTLPAASVPAFGVGVSVQPQEKYVVICFTLPKGSQLFPLAVIEQNKSG